MSQFPEDDTGSLERARERLYKPVDIPRARAPLAAAGERVVPHAWEEGLSRYIPRQGKQHVRLAGIFFTSAVAFFLIALGVASYFFYFGSNAVSIDKIAVDIQGPTTVAGGDVVPLSITITNKNPVELKNATIEINFPSGTRDASNVLLAYPYYVENLGTLASGATITRSVKAVLFGGAGQSIALPVSFSYKSAGSNAVFVKKSSYTLVISTTPLSVSVDALTETVSNKPLTFTLNVRSNATVPLDNVVLVGSFPFGFSVTSSSLPLTNSSFLLGTLKPGANKSITLTGTLTGQNNEQRVFHFTVGTANAKQNQTLAVSYMTQDASVTIAAPFIDTKLSLNGDISGNTVITPGSTQNATVSYTNTLPTSIENATVSIALGGSALDYNSVKTTSGFYNSADHTIVFSRDTDPALESLAPGASGVGSFTFSTLPVGTLTSSPTANFTLSVSGTRVGQSNVPEQVSASVTKIFKVATVVALTASSLHSSGPLTNTGPLPPRANQATTYSIIWDAQNKASIVADGTVSATLPSYVSYTGVTSGAGSFSYNDASRTVSWSVGDLAQGGSARGVFQVSLTPSTSQKGAVPQLTGRASFTGHDRFAGVQVSATADPVTTETKGDPGYVSSNASVQ